jgi:c-di-AMP phosphodiesterase-like protein
MPELKKSALDSHIWIIYLLALVSAVILWYFQWPLGLILLILVFLSFSYTVQKEKGRRKEIGEYIAALSHRVQRVGDEALLEMPFGILLYNEEFEVEWSNPYMNDLSEESSLAGLSLDELSEELIPVIKEEKQEFMLDLKDRKFQVVIRPGERLLYFLNRTEQVNLEELYENDQTVLAIIYLDNYEEITQNMDDTAKSKLNSLVTSILNDWAKRYGVYLKRTSQERFVAVATRRILEELEEVKFDILDEVREKTGEENNALTLSIGIGDGDVDLPQLGELAQSSLDLVLGRGGDQVAIKDNTGKVRFYGGKTNPMEKRTRVRARVISHALRELVLASDKVIIMGHKSPDMDSVGAAIGILKIAQANNVEGYVVFDRDDIDIGVHQLVEAVKEDEDLWQYFIEPADADNIITNRSLIVVVDTHKPSLVADSSLLNKTEYKVVIDHHRRGEDFIENATLVYMEPYASSTAELVTELLEYQPKTLKLNRLEATALLAGIIVDTKSFTLRTGSRTFEAASYLRSRGADTVLVQHFMKQDLSLYVKRSKLIERAKFFREEIAIATAEPGITYGPVVIAQAADTLLTMTGVSASFVISEREDGRIGISARSLGAINVQVIMERMNGGGHLTNAATQVEDMTLESAESLLIEILNEYYEGRETT